MTTSVTPEINHQETSRMSNPDVSIVLPIYNEVESLPQLLDQITRAMQETQFSYEIICVDDGSSDGSTELLKEYAHKNSLIRSILLRRNYGQTPAMSAGFNHSRGQLIVALDADLQNDPQDIPTLLNKLNEGYDLVSGWRKGRYKNESFLIRVLPSRIANWLIGEVTGVKAHDSGKKLHDYGCSLKAYRAEVLADMNLYGELHRFLPALAFIEGAKITEVPVTHHKRQFGTSKYGLGRTIRVVMDLFTIWFMKKFLTRPMHVFGSCGVVSMTLGFALGLYLTILKFGFGAQIGDRPLLMVVVILLVAGLQLFSFGLLGELLMRTYHESQNRPIYRVREVVESEKS